VFSRTLIVDFLRLFLRKHQLQENQLDVYCGAAYKLTIMSAILTL